MTNCIIENYSYFIYAKLGQSTIYRVIRNPDSHVSKSSFLQSLRQNFPLSLSMTKEEQTAESWWIFVAVSGHSNDPTIIFRVVDKC